jgi:hypothetical protein
MTATNRSPNRVRATHVIAQRQSNGMYTIDVMWLGGYEHRISGGCSHETAIRLMREESRAHARDIKVVWK